MAKLTKNKMGVLEEVRDLKNKKIADNEIIGILRERGVSPKSISDAFNQAKIKDAISSQGPTEGDMELSVMRPENTEPGEGEELPTEGSISDEDLTPIPLGSPLSMQQGSYGPMHEEEDEEVYVPQPQVEYSPQQYSGAPTQQYPSYQAQPQVEYSPQQYPTYPSQSQEYGQPQEYMPQEGYEYQTQSMVGAVNTDTIIEISEQVFTDKMKTAMTQLESLNEFKTLSEIKIENISERLKRMESSIDKLQAAILEKVGSYGRGLDNVKKEMEMVQDSFSKIVNVAAEKSHTHHKHHQAPEHHTQHHHTKSTRSRR